jgi:cyclic pyranopterin monophosphate synthase
MPKLTHFDEDGNARMVDVGHKPITMRQALAEGWIQLSEPSFTAVTGSNQPKGDALVTAQLAGIQAAKRTPDLIPLCHPIPLTSVTVELHPDESTQRVHCTALVCAEWKTGVEMEALTATTAALLTIYDMLKAVDRGMVLGPIRLCEKRGGRSGHWQRPQDGARS